MKIYSGKVCMGTVGEPTTMVDETGKKLHVGDIVATYTVDRLGVSALKGLTAVVKDDTSGYAKQYPYSPYFVMGIAEVAFMSDDEWCVVLLKSHKHVVAGEQWPDFGFSYKGADDE